LLQNIVLEKIKESYINYLIYGPHSTKKIVPLHEGVEYWYRTNLPSFDIQHIGNKGEYIAEGQFFNKNVDLAIWKNSKEIEKIVSVKFPMTTIKSNLINYLEGALGECYNLENYPCEYFFVLRYKTPELSVKGKVKSITIIDSEFLSIIENIAKSKYIDHLHILVVDIIPTLEEPYNMIPTLNILLKELGISDFDKFIYKHVIAKYGFIDLNLLRIFHKYQHKPLWDIRTKIHSKRRKEIEPIFKELKTMMMNFFEIKKIVEK